MEYTDVEEFALYYAERPYQYVKDIIIADPTPQQKEVLDSLPQAIKDRKSIAIKSGHGVGKTALLSWIIKWFSETRPYPKIPCTAPTQHQLFDVLWSELAKWHNNSTTKSLSEWTKTHLYNKKFPENWFAVARTSNKPDGMQGFHADHLLFIVDEASGVDINILEVIEGSQTQEGALVIMCGNPTQISGGFFDAFHSKRAFYNTFTFSSNDSPMVEKRYGEKIAAKYGKDSDIYRVRVLGEFPKGEPDTLIGLDRIERAIIREMTEESYNVVEIGADIARFGDDETTIYSRHGNIIIEEGFLRKRDLMTVVSGIVMVIKKYQGNKKVLVNIDDSGLGGGVTDRLKQMVAEGDIRCQVYGVNNGSKPKSEDFVNVGSEMWWFMREWITLGKIPNDNDLIAQLSGRKYKVNSHGKIEIEQKAHMKERGLTSPDRADGAILTLRSLIYPSIDRRGMSYAC